jgi:Domain of unknown function (DUF1824)
MNPTHDKTIEQAQALLAEYSCVTPKMPANLAEKSALQKAVKLIAEQTDNQILGILASTPAEALRALREYTQTLNLQMPDPPPLDCTPPIYLKFNPQTGLCYASSYEGSHRGVLISVQSELAERINATYGHLPLDLFE